MYSDDRKDELVEKLKSAICAQGYTKNSFSKISGVPLRNLNALLNRTLGDKKLEQQTFEKALSALKITQEKLISMEIPEPAVNLIDHFMLSDKAKRQYDLLIDILNLCAIYY